MMHPAALAWGNLRAEEQERSWLTMHRRMAGADPGRQARRRRPRARARAPAPARGCAAPADVRGDGDRGGAGHVQEDAARAAEAVAAAFRNMGRGAAGGGTRAIGARVRSRRR